MCRNPVLNVLMLVVLIVIGTCTVLLTGLWGQRRMHRRPSFREESIRSLLSAQSPDALRAVVSPLGALIHFPDGTWIAMRVNKSPERGKCSAVVLDSTGTLYETEKEVFCPKAYFDRINKATETWEDSETSGRLVSVEERHEDILYMVNAAGTLCVQFHGLVTAENLQDARECLNAMGFRSVTVKGTE